jgi:3-deoxy-D-manno-octulosonic-acid transferase
MWRASNYQRKYLLQRLGVGSQLPKAAAWIHCASVGEVITSGKLITELMQGQSVVVTTSTVAGGVTVTRLFGSRVDQLLLPYDVPFLVKRFLTRLQPTICVVMETELWPNMIHHSHKLAIPLVLINARLSERSVDQFSRYAPKLIQKTLNKFSLIAVQDQVANGRFIKLGADQNKLIIGGNLKFDTLDQTNPETLTDLKKIIKGRKTVVFGSTHNAEEDQIISSICKYQSRIDALLIIVPRHPERFEKVYHKIIKSGLTVEKRTETIRCKKDTQVLLGDTMGELMSFYSLCDVAFVGGSLDGTGGHNMLEAAYYSKPIIFGPNVSNFSEIAQSLLDGEAAIQVESSDVLIEKVCELLSSNGKRFALGLHSNNLLKQNTGSSLEMCGIVEKFKEIESQNMNPAPGLI